MPEARRCPVCGATEYVPPAGLPEPLRQAEIAAWWDRHDNGNHDDTEVTDGA